MAGFQERLNESLRLKLSLALCGAILLLAALAGAVSFASAFDEAHELQDDMLRQVAALMERQGLAAANDSHFPPPGNLDEESALIIQRLGAQPPAAGVWLPLPATLPDGLQSLTLNGESFRVLVRTMPSKTRIAIAQETHLRDEIARDGALRTVAPFLVLIPLLWLIVARLVRNMFQPIATLSREIDRRAELDLRPVEALRVPLEVRPFVVAINRLLGRVGQSLEAQRRFIADAAHELRSPLTALSLQAERCGEADMSDAARARLATLRQGIERGRQLLEQLLALARAQSAAEPPAAPLSVKRVYRQVLAEMLPLAEAGNIDLGIDEEQELWVWASELDLATLIKNLVDNAIRYTPRGGRVDLSATLAEGKALLRVRDTGPGIAPAERDKVFAPFYRSLGSGKLGSGLGLSIVKTIAERIGAEVSLGHGDPAHASGLCVTVSLPAAPPAA